VDAEKDYLRYHTEENVKRIAATGVRMPRILHFYKGFGLTAEHAEMQRTVELSRLLHQYGLKVPVYIGGTMFSETFFSEQPEAQQWVRIDQWGQPVTYAFHQTERYFACLNQPGYVDYLKKVLCKAVVEAKADRIFFDNFTLYAEPQSCHNEACVREFGRYLLRQYDAEGLIQRFGFADISRIKPPIWNTFNQPWDLPVIDDPLLQEWVDFRCWTIAHYYRQLYDYIKSLNPAVSVGVNIKGIMGHNRPFRDGIDFARFAEIGDWFELDPGYAAGVRESGALVSQIRSYKMAQSLGVPFDFEAETELRAAEYMVFNPQKNLPGFGYNGGFRELFWIPHLFRYFDFFRDNDERYYREARSIADVAILRGYATTANNNWSVHRSTILAEQVLIQDKIPFHIIFDRHLAKLTKYKVLVLADQECLCDADLQKVKIFVEHGGGLVATGSTADFDQWRRRRHVNGLVEVLGFKAGQAGRGIVGKGRVVYLPRIIPSLEAPPTPEGFGDFRPEDWTARSGYRDFEPEYWVLPKNWREISEAIRWAAGGPLSAEIQAPLTTVSELTHKPAENLMLLHLLNYDLKEPAQNIRVDLSLPVDRGVKSVTQLSPDDGSQEALQFDEAAGRVRFHISNLRKYTLAVVELLPKTAIPEKKR
jgi:hypothetical protein